MKQSLAITVVGQNKPGLISNLSIVAANHGANWLESHMANMAGHFAGIVHLDIASENVNALRAAFSALETHGLSITIAASTANAVGINGRELSLELIGQDHPGIVSEISQALANNNISIEELETECVSGSMSGGSIFKAHARLVVPDKLTTDELEQILQDISDGLMVEFALEEDLLSV